MTTNPSKVTEIAMAEIGYLEKKSNSQLYDKTANAGSNNYTKYWADLKPSWQAQAWCNAFVNWIFVKAFGETEAKKLLCTKGEWSYYTPTSAQYFKDKKQWYSAPKIGDCIFFKNSTRIHHIGYVYKVDSSRVYTIEGNTDAGEQVIPNGGCVAAKSYILTNGNIAGYGRPKYSAVQVVDIPISCGRAGLKITGTTALNIRSTPKDGKIVGVYTENQMVQVTAKALAPDGSYWFKTDNGYISGKFVEGWISEVRPQLNTESSGSGWWYVMPGYTYPQKEFKLIDNKTYVFDEDGWMLDQNSFNQDGSLK